MFVYLSLIEIYGFNNVKVYFCWLEVRMFKDDHLMKSGLVGCNLNLLDNTTQRPEGIYFV